MITLVLLAATCMSCALPEACPAGPERIKNFQHPRISYVRTHTTATPLGAPVVPACVAVQMVHVTNDNGRVDTLPALALLPCPDEIPAVDSATSRRGSGR